MGYDHTTLARRRPSRYLGALRAENQLPRGSPQAEGLVARRHRADVRAVAVAAVAAVAVAAVAVAAVATVAVATVAVAAVAVAAARVTVGVPALINLVLGLGLIKDPSDHSIEIGEALNTFPIDVRKYGVLQQPLHHRDASIIQLVAACLGSQRDGGRDEMDSERVPAAVLPRHVPPRDATCCHATCCHMPPCHVPPCHVPPRHVPPRLQHRDRYMTVT